MTTHAQRRKAYSRQRVQHGLALEQEAGVDPHSHANAGRIKTYHQVAREMENAETEKTAAPALRKTVKRLRLLLSKMRTRLGFERRTAGLPKGY